MTKFELLRVRKHNPNPSPFQLHGNSKTDRSQRESIKSKLWESASDAYSGSKGELVAPNFKISSLIYSYCHSVQRNFSPINVPVTSYLSEKEYAARWRPSRNTPSYPQTQLCSSPTAVIRQKPEKEQGELESETASTPEHPAHSQATTVPEPIPQHPDFSTEAILAEMSWLSPYWKSLLAPLCEPELTACKPQSTSVQQIENDEMILAMKTECLDSLKEYVPTTQMYDTRYLETFVHHLPLEGGKNLMKEIIKFSVTPKKLRQLRNFLAGTILKPGMFRILTFLGLFERLLTIMLKFNLPTNPKLTMASVTTWPREIPPQERSRKILKRLV
ncbi:Putative protein of unknown function [Podospora comata]|uniref:Uncharacterized protein n=1 Tax=Podospora comata TaxID=48703 RepID=A0ABY6SLR8_PODCO|nr:Putative protein of unknown function [Podospora comata]